MQRNQQNQSGAKLGFVFLGVVITIARALLGWAIGSGLGLIGSIIGVTAGGMAGRAVARFLLQGGNGNKTKL